MANELESFFKGGEAEAESKPKTAQEVVQAPEQAPMRREASDLEAVLGGSAQPTAQAPEDDDDISPLGMLWDVGAQLSEKVRTPVADFFRSVPAGGTRAVASASGGFGDFIESGTRWTEKGIEALGVDPTAWNIEGGQKYLPSQVFQGTESSLENVAGFVDAPEERKGFHTAVGEALGQLTVQALAFKGGGSAQGLGFFGLQGADMAKERAEAAGASPDQQEAAMVTGGIAVGLSERMGMDLLLNRVPPNIKNEFLRKITDISLSGGIEATEEWVERTLLNLSEKGIYNPDRQIFELPDEEEAAAGVAASIMRTILGAKGPSQQELDLSKLEEDYKKMVETGEIQGPHVPNQLRESRAEVTKLEKVLEEEVNIGVEVEPHVQEFLKNRKLSLSQLLKLNTEGRGTISEEQTAKVATVLPGYKGKEQAPGEVVDTGFTFYQEELMQALQKKEQIDTQIDTAVEAGLELDTETIKQAETLKEDVNKLERLAEVEQQFSRSAASIMKDQVQALAPNMKVYIGDNTISQQFKGLGYEEIGTSHARTFKTSDGVHVIEFDIANMLDNDGNFVPGLLQESVNHEFGHALINDTFETQTPKVREALTNAYLKWLNKATKDQSLNEFLKSRHGFFWNHVNAPGQGTARHQMSLKDYVERMQVAQEKRLYQEATTGQTTVKSADEFAGKLRRRIQDRLEYEFGMTEWTAIQAEKSLSENVSNDPEVRKYFKRINGFLRKLYNHHKKSYGYDKSYQTFLRLLQAQKSYAAMVDTYNDAKQQNLNRNYDSIVQEQVADMIDNAVQAGQVGGGAGIGSNWIRPPYSGDDFRKDADVYNKGLRYGLTLIQLAKLNPHINGLKTYVSLARQWWNTKMAWTAQADERLKQWKSLGGKRADWLGKFMLDLTVESYNLEKQLGPNDPEFKRLAERWNLDEDMFAVYDLMSQDFTQVLETLEEALVNDAQRQFAESPDDLKAALTGIQKDMQELRNRNYFPLSRFGQFFVRVKALKDQVLEGQAYKTGEVTSFETYETEKAMNKRLRQLEKSKEVKAVGGEMSDIQRQFSGFPPQFIEMFKNRLGLTEEQQGELAQLMHDIAPGQSYRKHLKQRKNTPGFSQDAVRSYASYFLHFSNHIARVQYKGALLDAIMEVKESADTKRAQETQAVKRDQITKHLQRHYDYIMNPGNELSNLRALGFIWYLGFVPKSAVVNLTQVPLVTLPYLSARHGDGKAMKALLKAQKDVVNYWRNPQKLTPGQHNMLEELKKSGIIDESMATELAATSEGSTLQRLIPGTFLKSEFAGRAIRDFAGRAAWMFQQAEKYNRRISALAAYDLAKQNGKTQEVAVEAAWDAVESTQYEYARWNRPEFMQGKKSTFFLFWQYLQNTLFFAKTDPGRERFILMLLAMAGTSGLPFGEDLMDLYDYLARKYNKWTGREKLPINSRKEIREFIAELGANPDLVMHGASRYTFGLPAVGDAIGVPIPNTDMSGSLSLGRIIPGVEPTLGRQGDFNTRMARAGEEVVGAVWTMPIQLMRAIADDNPNTLKRFEKAMPSFARNLSKAYRYAASQEETIANGAALAEFDLQDSKHVAEIIAQGAGFAPTRLQEAKEKYYMTREIAQYYEIRRRQFMRLLDFARANDDRKMEADVWDQIRDYNNSVPFPAFKLTGKDIKNSIKNRTRSKVDVERGRYTTKRGTQMGLDVDKAFPNLDEEEEPTPQGLEDFFTEPAPK